MQTRLIYLEYRLLLSCLYVVSRYTTNVAGYRESEALTAAPILNNPNSANYHSDLPTPSNKTDPESLLLSHLLTGYNKVVRPTKNSSEAITVTLGVALTQIISLDEKNQILTSNCWLNQVWMDEKLSWDPVAFDNITSVLIPVEHVWRPDILLYNNADSEYYHKMISTNAILQHTGNLTWLSTTIIRSTCAIDVRFFPFDKQICVLKFASWTFDGFKLDLVVLTETGDVSNYVPSMEWQLKNFTAKRNLVYYSCCAEPYPDITMTITIQRRPFFYVYNHLMPCGVATLFAFLGFYAPGESGEKVTLGITTLLSLTLFMLMVGEAMPPTATSLPLISLYYGFCMCVIGLSTAVQVFTLNIHYRGARGRQPPESLKRLMGMVGQALLVRGRASLLRRSARRDRPERAQESGSYGLTGPDCTQDRVPRRRHYHAPLASVEGTPEVEEQAKNERMVRIIATRLTATLTEVCRLIDTSESRYKERLYFDNNASEWTDIAHVLDKLLLVIFVTGTFLLTLHMLWDVPYFWES